MYFLYRFQMKNTKVFIGFTNQLKEVFGRLEHKWMKRSAEAQATEQHISSSSLVPCQHHRLFLLLPERITLGATITTVPVKALLTAELAPDLRTAPAELFCTPMANRYVHVVK